MLTKQERNQLYKAYSAIYKKALPQAGGLHKESFEIAEFGMSENIEQLKKFGLGLQIISEHASEANNTLIGHTGKILLNLPWQFMPEHMHTDIEILPNDSEIPNGYQKVSERVNNFFGIYEYNSDGSVKKENGKLIYRFQDSEYKIVMPVGNNTASNIESEFHFEGKSETFKFIGGDAVLFSDDAVVLRSQKDPSNIPNEFQSVIDEIYSQQKITTKNLTYMSGGTDVLLPKHTKHAIVAGAEGAVYIEFSTPSIDEADMFTDERIIR